MEVDRELYNKSSLHTIFSENLTKINHSSVILRDYQNAVIPTLGECLVEVQRGLLSATLPLIITEGKGVYCRNWFERLSLTIAGVSQILSIINYQQEYPDEFKTNLGFYRGTFSNFCIGEKCKTDILYSA